MDFDKVSKEDYLLIELHKIKLASAKQEVELRDAQMRLLVLSLFKKYKLDDVDQISTDGSIVRAETKETKEMKEEQHG